MQKTILIVTDNLSDQVNGVVTTYKNIEACAIRDGFRFVYITPNEFSHFDCPVYHEVKIAVPWKMGKKIEEIRPDYIHIATEGPVGLWARAYLTKHNHRYNTAYHTKFPEGLKTLIGLPESFTWRYIKWFHKHTGKVLTTTDTMVNQLKDHGLVADIIPWTRGVDRDIFNPSRRNRYTKKNIELVCVSRVSKEKNLDDFCSLQYPNSRKTMVGDGPYLNELSQKYPDVNFVGMKKGKELAKYYANADVFVFPSKWETFGLVMIESMACGTPVAAYPEPGPLDVVDGKTGYLSNNLNEAIDQCLKLNRFEVYKHSFIWSWESAWNIFRNNLVESNFNKEQL